MKYVSQEQSDIIVLSPAINYPNFTVENILYAIHGVGLEAKQKAVKVIDSQRNKTADEL